MKNPLKEFFGYEWPAAVIIIIVDLVAIWLFLFVMPWNSGITYF